MGAAAIARREGATRGPAPKPVPAEWIEPINRYIEGEFNVGRAATTNATRRTHLEHLARQIRCSPSDVTPKRLVEWFDLQDHWAVETRRGVRNTLLSFFGWCLTAGVTTVNPATAIPRVKQVLPPPRPAPDDAWRLALATADRRTLLMLRLAGEAGLRRAEIAQLHTRDLKDGTSGPQLVVHGKGNKWRVIPISESLAASVRAGAAGHTAGGSDVGWLFPSTSAGGHVSAKWVGKLMTRVLPDGWSAHTLRHRFATRAYQGSKDIRAVQQLIGHSSVSTTERYTLVGDDQLRAAMMAAL
ncbi:tyrosine-type recombinase/integrase [Mycolicibacterium bacteremicum]|uniref:tyrosine-type recombinase/integrase n=1 Tax=Mycolicibacterium bacteremicum TaxID=564198 RepID=UPI0026EE1B54|nr:tyrosine-type recombinase/integrase [Mycolicibacterium bacteremicum]